MVLFWWGCCSFAAWAFCQTVRTTNYYTRQEAMRTNRSVASIVNGFLSGKWLVYDLWRSWLRVVALGQSCGGGCEHLVTLVLGWRRYVNLGWASPSYVKIPSSSCRPSYFLWTMDWELALILNMTSFYIYGLISVESELSRRQSRQIRNSELFGMRIEKEKQDPNGSQKAEDSHERSRWKTQRYHKKP